VRQDGYAKGVDHVVCLSALHFLRPELFSFALVLFFARANKSITISVDEIPDTYNENLDKIGYAYMHSTNHISSIEAFGEPPGWKLTRSERSFSWTSHATGDDVYTTYFRFDRIDGESRQLLLKDVEVPN
jgi:hypothetical protein